MVPGLAKTRVARCQPKKLGSRGIPVQLTNVAPVLTSARTIQLPSSTSGGKGGASLTTNIPVARVILQQQASVSGAGFVAFVNQSSGQQQARPVTVAPVSLKPSPALPVRVPAATAGQRPTVVSQQPALGAVTLTQPLTSHIQVSVTLYDVPQ